MLAGLVQTHFPSVAPLLMPVREWTAWSVAYRYPNEAGLEPEPSVEELVNALGLIEELKTVVRLLAQT